MALQGDGLKFVALEDSIDTRTTESRVLYFFLACPVVFEQVRRRERKHRGLDAARVWDWRSGWPPALERRCPKQAAELPCADPSLFRRQPTWQVRARPETGWNTMTGSDRVGMGSQAATPAMFESHVVAVENLAADALGTSDTKIPATSLCNCLEGQASLILRQTVPLQERWKKQWLDNRIRCGQFTVRALTEMPWGGA